MKCEHNKLIAKKPIYQAISVDVGNKDNFTPEYFSYKKYICKDCQKTVIVLSAIVEQ